MKGYFIKIFMSPALEYYGTSVASHSCTFRKQIGKRETLSDVYIHFDLLRAVQVCDVTEAL
jgi:hypothetical protein